MANKANLPLPVYRVKDYPFPPDLPIPETHFEPNLPRLRRTFPTDELIDLQEWLISTSLKIRGKTLIADVADSLGGAHYDEDVSELVEILAGINAFDSDQLTAFLCGTAEIIGLLAEWILAELGSRRIVT